MWSKMFNGANSRFMLSETCPTYGSTTVAVGLSSSRDGLVCHRISCNGYPSSVIANNSRTYPKLPRPSREEDKPTATVVLPYVGHVSESIKRLLAPLNIRTCFRPHKTLRELLVHPKDHIPDIKKPGVVYNISCKDCDNVYVG